MTADPTFFQSWSTADWTQVISGIVLFFIGWFLGWRQAQLIKAMAELNVQEKTGVMMSNAVRDQRVTLSHSRIECLLQDSRSVLRMLPYCPEDVRADYIIALKQVFLTLADVGTRQNEELRDSVLTFIGIFRRRHLLRSHKKVAELLRRTLDEVGHALETTHPDEAKRFFSVARISLTK